MTSTRTARTRRDTGELTRDQRREKSKAANLAATIEPEVVAPKWVKRGVQPEVIPEKPSGATLLARLSVRMRDEPDKAERARLQAEYDAEVKVIAAMSESAQERNMREVYTEIVSTFAPVIAPKSPQEVESLEMPEAMTRPEWLAFHRRLVTCRHHAGHWLSKSRRFAMERWGLDFVTDSETQMELALGLESKPRIDVDRPVFEVACAQAMAARMNRLSRSDPTKWPKESVETVAEALRPIVEFAERVFALAR